jgi:anti-sigma factor RsiW
LAKQYLHYGRWRREIMRQHPQTVSARYLAPPVAVTVMSAGLAASGLAALMGSRRAWLGLVPAAGYAAAIVAGGMAISADETPAVRVRVPLALATMHLSWGTGFLLSPGDLRT